MSHVTRPKFLELAKSNRWSQAYAAGFVHGEALRKRKALPPKFLLVAIDEYSVGFRAGYFVRRPVAIGQRVRHEPPPNGDEV